MTDEIRAAVAFIIGNKDREGWSIAVRLYDQKRIKYIAYNLQKGKTGINMYDYDRGTYLGGNMGNICDYDTGTYINIRYSGDRFSGTDMTNLTTFQGILKGNSIYIHDNQTNEFYYYSIH